MECHAIEGCPCCQRPILCLGSDPSNVPIKYYLKDKTTGKKTVETHYAQGMPMHMNFQTNHKCKGCFVPRPSWGSPHGYDDMGTPIAINEWTGPPNDES